MVNTTQNSKLNRFVQGYYTPRNPHKYKGDINKIMYRSSWELRAHAFFDGNPNVLEWSSEEIVVPYIKPTDGKIHKYYVDYYVKYKKRDNTICEELIEVKPAQQTRPTKNRNPKYHLIESIKYEINKAKWIAAKQFAESRGWLFRIVTENQLFK